MLKYMFYREKDEKCIIKEGLDYEIPTGKDFACIFLAKPSEAEISKVTRDFSLKSNGFKTYTKATHSVRYSTQPFQFVFVDYYLENDKIDHTRILFMLEKNYLIISVPVYSKYHDELFYKIVEDFKRKENGNIGYLLYSFLAEDTEENYDVLEFTEKKIIDLEKRLIRENEKILVDAEDILKLKRELFRMTRRFWASAKIIFAIKKGLTPVTLDKETLNLLDDVYDTFHHQLDIASAQKDMLSDALEVYATSISNNLAFISNNLSKIMKRLTAFTVILMVPTLIAGIYGMNFNYIFEADYYYGFYIVVGVMISFVLLLGHYFRKKEWF